MKATHLFAGLSALIVAAPAPGPAVAQTLQAEIRPLNAETAGQSVTGTATLTVEDGQLTIDMQAEGLSPGMHLAHLHGFATASPEDATCAAPEQDANGDGIIDLMETEPVSGVTMIPMTDDPVSLSIQSESYPEADADGRATYRTTVPVADLEAALQEQFGSPPALAERVLYIHGVPDGTDLPDSVQSLEGVPASVTLPIACAEFD